MYSVTPFSSLEMETWTLWSNSECHIRYTVLPNIWTKTDTILLVILVHVESSSPFPTFNSLYPVLKSLGSVSEKIKIISKNSTSNLCSYHTLGQRAGNQISDSKITLILIYGGFLLELSFQKYISDIILKHRGNENVTNFQISPLFSRETLF